MMMMLCPLVFLAGLSLGSLAAESSTEDVCVSEECAVNSASARNLLQQVPTENRVPELIEEDSADAAVGADAKATSKNSFKRCDKWKKEKVIKKLGKVEKALKEELSKDKGRSARCKVGLKLMKTIEKDIARHKKCISKLGLLAKDGSLGEDSVSETSEDVAQLDQLNELIGSEADKYGDLESLDEKDEDDEEGEVDEEEDDEDNEDNEDDEFIGAEIEEEDASTGSEVAGPDEAEKKKPPPCIKEDAEKGIAKLEKFRDRVSKDIKKEGPKCKENKRLERLNKKIDHFTKCL